ncbi:hypothetical protein [Mucilaginibacter antarcticus]|uniref:hypothetical protein n=1 Tax=Mucilaginibacter antarcticus TaxID=1855725 RepID=UPI0036278520
MKKQKIFALILPVIALGGLLTLNALKADPPSKSKPAVAGLTVPTGFDINVIADKLGSARHLVITPKMIFTYTWPAPA